MARLKISKYLSVLLSILLFSINPGFASGELEIGADAPSQTLKLKDLNGKNHTLKSLKEKNGLLVIFSCNTCPWVVAWENRYNELDKIASENGIKMIAVNSNEAYRGDDDSEEAMKQHAKKQGYTFPYLVDSNSSLADAFGATRTPHVFLFDSNMKLVYRGAIDDSAKDISAVSKPYLKNALMNLGQGKMIEPNTTRSLGCGIKRKTS